MNEENLFGFQVALDKFKIKIINGLSFVKRKNAILVQHSPNLLKIQTNFLNPSTFLAISFISEFIFPDAL